MRDFTTNSRLLTLLQTIEDTLGQGIHATLIPEKHNLVAEGYSVNISGEIPTFLYTPGKKVPEDILCHELMHLVLYIEGFPGFGIPTFIEEDQVEYQVLSMVYHISLHLKVWELTEKFGFSESSRYDSNIMAELIPRVEARVLLTGDWPELVRAGVATYLANGLLCPCAEATKARLREAAKKSYPQFVELTDAICQVYEKSLPLSPKSCCEGVLATLRLIGAPIGYLRPEFLSHPHPGFLASVEAMAQQHQGQTK